jgi:hypothetical protein
VKKLFGLLVALLCFATASLDAKDVHVKGYTRKDGTYVAPYTRTAPNKTRNDNYSTQGNVNPYTGQRGTKLRDDAGTLASSAWSSVTAKPATIQTEQPALTGWSALKSGTTEAELRRQLGTATEIEAKGAFEIWSYPSGTVFVKAGKVIAWQQGGRR